MPIQLSKGPFPGVGEKRRAVNVLVVLANLYRLRHQLMAA